MPSISPFIVNVFDESHSDRPTKHERNRARFETKGRVLRRRSKQVD